MAPSRRHDIVITDLGSEHVLLDPTTEVAHTVTPHAAAIFAACDGSASTAEIVDSLGLAFGDVETAIAEFADAGLLETGAGVTRRRMLAGAGFAGAAVLGTVVLPAARAAASPTNPGSGGNSTTYDLVTIAAGYSATQTGVFRFYRGQKANPAGATAVSTAFTTTDSTNGGTAKGFDVDGSDYGVPTFYTVSGGTFAPSAIGTISVPAGSFATHPGPGEDAIIAFTVPTNASSVVFNGTVTARNTSAGNGDGIHRDRGEQRRCCGRYRWCDYGPAREPSKFRCQLHHRCRRHRPVSRHQPQR